MEDSIDVKKFRKYLQKKLSIRDPLDFLLSDQEIRERIKGMLAILLKDFAKEEQAEELRHQRLTASSSSAKHLRPPRRPTRISCSQEQKIELGMKKGQLTRAIAVLTRNLKPERQAGTRREEIQREFLQLTGRNESARKLLKYKEDQASREQLARLIQQNESMRGLLTERQTDTERQSRREKVQREFARSVRQNKCASKLLEYRV